MAYLWFDSKVVLSRLASSFPLTPLHGLLVAVGMAGVATYWGGGGGGGEGEGRGGRKEGRRKRGEEGRRKEEREDEGEGDRR